MLLGTAAFIGCLVCLAMGIWEEDVIRAMLYINGAITVFMVGCGLIVYRSAVLTDIAQAIHDNGSKGTATILEAEYNGRLRWSAISNGTSSSWRCGLTTSACRHSRSLSSRCFIRTW